MKKKLSIALFRKVFMLTLFLLSAKTMSAQIIDTFSGSYYKTSDGFTYLINSTVQFDGTFPALLIKVPSDMSGEVTIPETFDFVLNGFSGGESPASVSSGMIVKIPRRSITFPGLGNCDWTEVDKTVTHTAKVMIISNEVFKNHTHISALHIPNSVVNIWSKSFANCIGIKSIELPSNLVFISDNIFSGCTNLQHVIINYDINEIQNNYFLNNIENLKSVEIKNPVKRIRGFANLKKLESIILPNSVTCIDSMAFYGCSSLTSINIPDNVSNIGYHAFSECTSLSSITIPNGVNTIDEGAFYDCKALESIILPNSVTCIDSMAFYGCSSLTSINIPDNVSNIGYYAFSECTRLPSITIPNGVNTINEGAFYGCEGITSITIGKGVKRIGADAFYDCKALKKVIVADTDAWFRISFENQYSNPLYYAHHLYYDENNEVTSVTIPEGVTTIIGNAFFGCKNITSVSIPNSVVEIGDWAFGKCNHLKSITIPHSVIKIGECAFYGCTDLTTAEIGNGIESIPSQTFSGCQKLKTLTIGADVKNIGGYAFFDCNSLQKVIVPDLNTWFNITFESDYSDPLQIAHHLYSDENTEITDLIIPDGVTTINEGAFKDCIGLKSISVPNSVEEIGKYAFENCTGIKNAYFNTTTVPCCLERNESLEQVELGDSVKIIEDYAFHDCINLSSVIPGDNIIKIGKGAFDSCKSLSSDIIGNHVVEIGDMAFSGCDINSLTLPNSVISIGYAAFHDNLNLSDITIGNGLKYVGSSAFGCCNNLQKVIINDMENWVGISFENASSNPISYAHHIYWDKENEINNVIIPEGVTTINPYAFFYCKGLTSVTIPNSVNTIGGSAFSDCLWLDTVRIGSGITHIKSRAFKTCTHITDFYCSAETVPTVETDAFDIPIIEMKTTLHVPAGMKEKYENANIWCNFKTIVEMSQDSEGIDGIVFNDKNSKIDVYQLNGTRRESLQKGLNIIHLKDGTFKKVIK